MKVLFLDIDGVMNSVQLAVMHHRRNKDVPSLGGWDPYNEFCPISINNLVELLEKVPDLKIVVSSTWRMGCDTVQKLQDIFNPIPELHGQKIIQERIIDRTPVFRSGPRGNEIKHWLDNHPEVEKYAILDDDSDMLEEQRPNFFNTNGLHGFMWEDCERVLKHFGGTRL